MIARIAYDARSLEPAARNAGVGVVIRNIVTKLQPHYEFMGAAHRFVDAQDLGLRTWPKILKLNNVMFEFSHLLSADSDLYWATNSYIPAFLRKKVVATVHDLLLLKYPKDERNGRIMAKRFLSSLRRADFLVADSLTTADDLARELPELRSRITVGLLGYEAPSWQIDCSNPDAENLYFVVLGAHRPRKNLKLALQSVKALRESGVLAKLVVTGSIDHCFSDELNRVDFVEKVGMLPKEGVFRLLSGAVALLFPSYYEGFGFPMLEAMAASCPVLALDTPINKEVSGGSSELLSEDPTEWARAMANLIHSRHKRFEMIGRGHENLRRFSWDSTASVYSAAFNRALGK